jgi:hypothetical protein
MKALPSLAALVLVLGTNLSAAPLAAEQAKVTSLPMSYEIFEAAVSHIDLEACPATLPQIDSFCRATVLHEELHVFAFSTEGNNLMIGFTSYAAENLAELLH